jgi:hypothetical protein
MSLGGLRVNRRGEIPLSPPIKVPFELSAKSNNPNPPISSSLIKVQVFFFSKHQPFGRLTNCSIGRVPMSRIIDRIRAIRWLELEINMLILSSLGILGSLLYRS